MAVASPQITNAYRLDEGRAMFVLGFPLLIVAFIIYNIVAFVTPGVSSGKTSAPPSRSCCSPSKS
jgi:hypothetical protein